MAFASDSTTAPFGHPRLLSATPVPTPALTAETVDMLDAISAEPGDRRAIACDGWDRARDHVAAGMRQAWQAARGLLPAEGHGAASEPAVEVAAPLLPVPAPLPSLTAALSRRRAIFGAVAVAAVPAVAVPAVAAVPTPRGPLTLAQAEAVDFGSVWRSLPADTQVRLGAMALRYEMLLQLEEDGGFHTTADDRETAMRLGSDVMAELRPAIWAALPGMMPIVDDEPYGLWQALDTRDPPAEVDVRRHGRCPLVKDGWEWFAVTAAGRRKLGGAVDLDSRDEHAPRRWQFWTAADIEAERLRRHPEMVGGLV